MSSKLPMRASIATSLLQQLRAAVSASGSRGLSGAAAGTARKLPEDGLGLAHFVQKGRATELGAAGELADAKGALQPAGRAVPQAAAAAATGQPEGARQRTAFIETYGW